jgi:serine/threonine-protein kinase
MTDENVVGQTIAGKYRVEKVLGKGGMGLVVGARHLKLDEPVAIKLLKPAMMEVAGMVSRFLREARAASKIKSIHVARVTDVDTLEDGAPYMVMEYLEGVDFSDLRKQQGMFGVAEAIGYVLQACDAIAEAHSLGIVHRDLKPGNLFLHRRRDNKTVVKVLDFGISKLESPGEQDTTKTGQMMGSPKYMSPEQMLSMRDVDARSDIWSLGAILYEFLTGRPPFVADTTPRICALVLNSDPEPPRNLRPEIPVEVEQTILRCLDKDPDRRFPDVASLVSALAPFGPAPIAEISSPRSTGENPIISSSSLRAVTMGPRAAPNPAPPSSALVAPISTPNPAPASITPTPGSVPGPTVAAWDATTKHEGTPPKKTGNRRMIAALAGVAIAAVIGALYATQRSGPIPAPGPAVAAATQDAKAAPASTDAPAATADPQKRAVSPSDLPDVDPAPSTKPAATPTPGGSGSFAKKPKPTPSADPFGGRRN